METFESKIILTNNNSSNEGLTNSDDGYNEHSQNKKKENKSYKIISQNIDNNKYFEKKSSSLNYHNIESIKKLAESLNNLEKYCKNNFDEINVKDIEKRLLSLEKNNKNYLLYEEELNNCNDKINFQEMKFKENLGKYDLFIQDSEKYKAEIKELIKKVDSLSFDVSKLSRREVNQINEPKNNTIDLNKYISTSLFNESKKESTTRFDKLQKKIEEHETNIENILNALVHTPTDKDFLNFQELIKNMLDNIIIKNKKIFASKFETVKSYKLLETKLNSLNDSYNKKKSGADNWLLAKKPLNMYQCASCESIIKGNLDQKSDYIAWNQYPYREENKSSYRMGHGFSHMLHMINEGLMKDTGENLNDEENKKVKKEEINLERNKKNNNNEDLSLDILPKLKKKSNIYDLSIGFDSPINKSKDIKQINKTNDNQENAPHIIRILKKNRSSIFKTVTNNVQAEKPKKNENNIKYINFTINNK